MLVPLSIQIQTSSNYARCKIPVEITDTQVFLFAFSVSTRSCFCLLTAFRKTHLKHVGTYLCVNKIKHTLFLKLLKTRRQKKKTDHNFFSFFFKLWQDYLTHSVLPGPY